MDIYVISVVLFFIIAFCYIGHRIITKKTDEEFINQYEFLTPEEAHKVIEESGYFDHFNTPNLRARLCANVTDCKFKYLKELMLVDPMEAEAIKWLVEIILDRLKENGISTTAFSMTLRFAKFSAKLEGNMPHTHKDVIYFPASYYQNVWKAYEQSKNKNEDHQYVIKIYGRTLIHELCHILQRKYESYFIDFYNNKWNFEQFNESLLDKCENIFQVSRLNPDGIDVKWLWKNPFSLKNNKKQEYYLLLAIFKDNHPKFLGDTTNTVYKLDKYSDRYRVSGIEKIEDNVDLNSYFGLKDNNYHPHEISAEYLSIYMLNHMQIQTDVNLSANKGYHLFSDFISRVV